MVPRTGLEDGCPRLVQRGSLVRAGSPRMTTHGHSFPFSNPSQFEAPAPVLEELAGRYRWLRYVQTLGIYQRSPLALLGLVQGL